MNEFNEKYMEFYCDFRNYAEIFIIQGLATSNKFISKYPIALIKFNSYLEYKKVDRIDIDFFQFLENEYNIKHNIKDKVDKIILDENNFILFSKEETKISTLYNTLKSISKNDLIIRYNLGTKNLKKDYINDLIEKNIKKEIISYIKELRRDILYLINKNTMEITQGNLDFLLDDYSNSLNIPFYEYVLKYIYNK